MENKNKAMEGKMFPNDMEAKLKELNTVKLRRPDDIYSIRLNELHMQLQI